MAFKCCVCDKEFRDGYGLKRHEKTHSSEKECQQCKRKFPSWNYAKHIIACKPRVYACDKCTKTFKAPSNLKRHVKQFHAKGPLLKCSKCKYSTKLKSRMKAHSLSSHGNAKRRRVCEECADSFETLSAFLLHRKQHERARAKDGSAQGFRCPHCRASFNARLARTAHMSHCGRRRRVAQQGAGGEGGDGDGWDVPEFALDGAATTYRLSVVGDVETKDVSNALVTNKKKMLLKLQSLVKRLKGLKFWITVRAGATRETGAGIEEEEKFLRSLNHIVFAGDSGEQQLERAILETVDSGDSLITRGGSSWQLTAVYFIELSVVEYAPISGSSYLPLPKALRNSKFGIVNIKNLRDSQCFRWCVLAKLHPVPGPHRHAERLHHYRPYYNDLNFGKLESENFKISDIPKFEKLNPNLSFTVVTVSGNNKNFLPVYSSYEEAETHVTLLHFTKKKQSHYALVKSLDTLLFSTTANRNKKFFCKFCFNKFSTAEKRCDHERLCRENGTRKTRLPPKGSKICFDTKMYSKCQRSEYVVYFDFETYMEEVEEVVGKKTRKIMRHIPFCYVIFVSNYAGDLAYGPFWYSADGGVVEHFISKVLEIEDFLFKNKKEFPANISEAQYEKFDRTFACDMCGERFSSPAEKIIDHEHFIEKDNFLFACHGYGPAEGKMCNALRRRSNMLTLVAHNSIKYDSILIWKAAIEHPALKDREIKVIPRTKSTYLSFSIHLDDGRGLVFIDSFRHVTASLDSLARTLAPEDMRVVNAYFKDDAKRALITGKGVWPYEYVRKYSQFKEDRLPGIESFYSSLSNSTISQDEWDRANNVFRSFECKTILDFAILYCIVDTALLCDIFSSYRRTTYDIFQLEAAKFVSGASLSWACALRQTRLKIENITDCDQFAFVERSVRGGQSFISARYMKANNEHCPGFDSSQPKTFLSVFDLTALYTGAMRMSLPCGEYEWVGPERFDLNVSETDDYCCYWEVDLRYDPRLHAEHRDFPLAPEKLHITEQILSPIQRRLLEAAGRTLPTKDIKLVSHLGPRKNYVCHALLLKEYVSRGMEVTRVHRGLRFRQKPILKPYMDYLVERRGQAKTDFEQSFYKLLGNSCFGFCLKNNRHHINVKIARTRRQLKKLTKSPFFHSFTIFGPDLIAVQMKQTVLKLDYPIIVGASILEKSKIVAYQTFFGLKAALGPSSRCAFHDTDSYLMMYEAESVEEAYAKIAHMMDFSNLSPDHEMYSTNRKKVPLYIKDEFPGKVIESFVGLRAKNYALKFCDDNESEVKKCKGIFKNTVKQQIEFSDYKKCLFENYEKVVKFCYIRDDGRQNMYTWETSKSALLNFDSKRYMCKNGQDTLPYFYEGEPVD